MLVNLVICNTQKPNPCGLNYEGGQWPALVNWEQLGRLEFWVLRGAWIHLRLSKRVGSIDELVKRIGLWYLDLLEFGRLNNLEVILREEIYTCPLNRGEKGVWIRSFL